MRLPSVNQVHREFLIIPLDFPALLDDTPSCALLTLLSNSLIR